MEVEVEVALPLKVVALQRLTPRRLVLWWSHRRWIFGGLGLKTAPSSSSTSAEGTGSSSVCGVVVGISMSTSGGGGGTREL